MKESKHQSRLATRSPMRSVSLQIRDYQVTVKVKTAVPQARQAVAHVARMLR
jgi:hypothetical protein